MNADLIMRRALWLGVPFNLFGATLFAFPGSALGQLAGLPTEPVPAIYRTVVVLFVALFGGMYGWLAMQPQIPRPMVVFSVIGKSAVFLTIVLFALLGLAPARAVLPALGDAAFAALFVGWLLRSRPGA